MEQVTNVTYYNLGDILKILKSRYIPSTSWYTTIVDKVNEYYGSSLKTIINDDFIIALGIYLNKKGMGIYYTEDIVLDEMDDDLALKLSAIINKNNIIIQDYIDLYNILNSELTTLKTQVVSKFNDTPTEEGDFSTDMYTSNVTNTTTNVDYDIGTRINVIKERMQHLIGRYCKEFEEFIIWTN